MAKTKSAIIYIIIAVVLGLMAVAVYFIMQSVEASIPTGYTKANCSASSEDWPKDTVIIDTGYQVLTRNNDAENGFTKRFYAVDGYSRTWDATINLRNNASGIAANQFRSGDKINVDMEFVQKGGTTQPVNKTFYLRVMNPSTGKPYSWGTITTTELTSLREISIPSDFTGQITIRFIINGGIANCGPAFNVWDKAITVLPKAGASVTPTATTTTTVSSTDGLWTLTLKKGFNAVYLPSEITHLSTSEIKQAGMTIWTFNQLGEKNWATTGEPTDKLDHKLGYYIYNPGEETTITIKKAISTAEESPHKIYPGWNLLANPTNTAKKLNWFGFSVQSSPAMDNCAFDALESCPSGPSGPSGVTKYLSALSYGLALDNTAYGMFIISDPNTHDPDKAFTFIELDDANRNTVEIPAGKMFWIYLWPN